MNTLAYIHGAYSGDATMPRIIFWLLLILWALGAFFGTPENPRFVSGTKAVMIILFAILGFYLFGF